MELERIAREAHAYRLAQVFESVCASLADAMPLRRAVLSSGSGASHHVMHEWLSGSTPSSDDAAPDVTIRMRRARGLDCTFDLYLADCDETWDAEFAGQVSVPLSNALSFAHGETSTIPPPPAAGTRAS